MKYLPHQIEYGKKLKKILKKKGYVYLVSPPRAGKTMTALYAVEHIKQVHKILIITKKNAFSGWELFTKTLKKTYVITNKESLHKVSFKDIDIVILDEAHTIGGVGKPTITHLKMQEKLWHIPQILISATPFVETHNAVYYQITKSKYNPFRKFKTFYDFFKSYGKPEQKRIGKDEFRETYKKSKKKLIKKINNFTVTMPKVFDIATTDKIHYIKLKDKHKKLYNTLVKDFYLAIGKQEFTGDTIMKHRVLLHQLEGGTLKDDNGDIWELPYEDNAKIQYIKDNFKEGKIGIMCHFNAEQQYIKNFLPNVEIYSSNSHAEGVDLSHLDHFIIYSQDYSGAKHIQRRDRLVNINGSNSLIVHHLLVKSAVSEQVYKTCSIKRILIIQHLRDYL